MTAVATTSAVLVVSYLIGSCNFSIIVLRLLGRPDPRSLHSGNAGTTNVARIAGFRVAALVVLLDMGRAVALARLAAYACPSRVALWAGVALLLGNRFPLWHGFRGGKGVANYAGFVAGLSPLGCAIACLGWVIGYAIARVSAVGSVVMVTVLAFSAVATSPLGPLPLAATALSLLLILHAHRNNWRARRKGPRPQVSS